MSSLRARAEMRKEINFAQVNSKFEARRQIQDQFQLSEFEFQLGLVLGFGFEFKSVSLELNFSHRKTNSTSDDE